MKQMTVPFTAEYFKDTCKDLEEKARRHFPARSAMQLGYGGISAVARVAGVSRAMIARGVAELTGQAGECPSGRNRRPGGGRKSAEETHRRNMEGKEGRYGEDAMDLHRLVESAVSDDTCGDPMTGIVYRNATLQTIADRVEERSGEKYSLTTIWKTLGKLGYSRQKNQKFDQVGNRHPNRDDQFKHIDERKEEYKKRNEPIISIDTKAKEKVGDFIRPGKEWRKTKDPRRVLDHDFAFDFKGIYPNGSALVPDELMGKPAIAIPYGVYCLNNNEARVSIGISSDTSEFAIDSMLEWWGKHGAKQFPDAKRILVLADGGGSNRARGNLFKIALQQFAGTTGLQVEIAIIRPVAASMIML